MNRRELLGVGLSGVCVLLTLPVLAAGGPLEVGAELGLGLRAGVLAVVPPLVVPLVR